LKKGDLIVIIFGTNISDITVNEDLTQRLFLRYPEKIKTGEICIKINKKSFNKLKIVSMNIFKIIFLL